MPKAKFHRSHFRRHRQQISYRHHQQNVNENNLQTLKAINMDTDHKTSKIAADQ